MENKVQFGLSNLHYALYDETTKTYEAPVKVPGAMTLSLDPAGDSTTLYADNIAYFQITANQGYTGELGTARFPDTMLADVLSLAVDSNGMLVELADAKQKPFALLCEIEGDQRKRRLVYYSVTGERPKDDFEAKKETVDVKTQSMKIVVAPIEFDGKPVVKGALELSATNETAYEAFFDAVLEPTWPVA